jgi:hypothetical protein
MSRFSRNTPGFMSLKKRYTGVQENLDRKTKCSSFFRSLKNRTLLATRMNI